MTRYQISRRRAALLSAGQAALLSVALVATMLPGAALAQTTGVTGVTSPTSPTAPTAPTAPTLPTLPTGVTGTGTGSSTGSGGITLPTLPTLPSCPALPTLPGGFQLPQIPFIDCIPGGGGGNTGGTGGNSGGSGPGGAPVIHIRKYVRDNFRTAPLSMSTTTAVSFPFTGAVTGTTTTNFTLGTDEVFVQAGGFVNGVSYTATEVNSGMASTSSVVAPGAACVAGHYRTVGYHAGSTLSGAEAAPLTATPPSFTNLTGDQYLIIVNEYCVTNDMPATTGGNGNGGGSATSTANTVVVHYSDLAQNSTDANANGKWFFWNGGTGAIDTTIGPNSFVTGPGQAPLGSGSVMLTATGTDSHSIATNRWNGIRLADLTNLSFDTYIPGVGISSTTFPVGTTTATTTSFGYQNPTVPFLAFNVNLGGAGATTTSGTNELIYMPEQNGHVATDTWQTWNALGQGLWTWSNFATSTTGTTTLNNRWPDLSMQQFRHWGDIISAFPNAVVNGMFGVGVQNMNQQNGSTTNASTTTVTAASTTPTAFLDDLTIGIGSTTSATTTASSTTIFDFEPGTAAVPSSGGGGGGGSSSGGGGGGGGSSSGGGGGGQVLGASCPLITSYMRQFQVNDPNQVSVLKNFLNGEMHSGLTVDSNFDTATTNWVNAFQVKYWQDVLLPWVPFGLPTDHTPTGYVYKTTSTKINRIACPGLTFPDPVLP